MEMDCETFVASSACRGDERAWRTLYEAHVDAVYQFCLGLAAGSPERAEEITQQAFMTAARRIHRFRPQRGTFRVWLLGIARNRHMAVTAKEQRRRRHESGAAEARRHGPARAQQHVAVHDALARLPSRYRKVLELKYLEGVAVKEIARTDGATVEATESLLRRARNRFAEVYARMQGTGAFEREGGAG
jgi:RNA polymerase sigma-70 factor (ECF subfamily)